jgi:hypothetical protein
LLPDSVEQMRATEDNPIAAMDEYFNHLYTEASESIGWYYRNRKRPALWARVFRWAAILLSVAGGLYPIWRGIRGVPAVGDLGYTLLATAAALIAVDRFGGLSSARMRYITTAEHDFRRLPRPLCSQGARQVSVEECFALSYDSLL